MSYPVAPARLEGAGYTIVEDASLATRNTLRVAARASLLIDVRDTQALPEVLAFPLVKSSPLFVLGGGSNVLFTRDYPGTVLSLASRGIQICAERDGVATVRAAAGENWNDLVNWTIAHGLCGLENLALIPGTVGAAPIQNIGAYGTEVREFVESVDVFDRHSMSAMRLSRADCEFAYRDSRFKRAPERYIVTGVDFALPRSREWRLDYSGVREEIAALGVESINAASIAEAITRLRLRKLPNPEVIGNAGSFFKNPVIDAAPAARLRSAYPALPQWPADAGRVKLSAAWLIETSGLKGFRDGDAGVSAQHALVLVNHGTASGARLWALAQQVRDTVRQRFDVTLDAEPVVI
ncbi:MAG: UDP-N-acetylmuramate dehydrogenase [Tahibacter sp.]